MTLRKSTLAFLLYYLCGLFIVVVAESVLPEKYFIDSNRIVERIISGDVGLGSSDLATAALYRTLTLGAVPPRWIIGAINYTVAIALLLAVYRVANVKWSYRPLIIFAIWCMLVAIYLGAYSKELFTFVLSGVVIWYIHRPSVRRFVVAMALLLAYGLAVRQYWLLILAFAVSCYVVIRLQVHVIAKIAAISVILMIMSVGVKVATGMYLTDLRILLTAPRVGSPDAVTIVFNAVANTSTLTDVINLLIAWASFMVPLSLFRTAAPQHIMFAIWQIVNVTIVFMYYLRLRRKKVWAGLPSVDRKKLAMIGSYLLAVTLVHAGFEGDYGSYVRHQISVVPVLLYFLVRYKSADTGQLAYRNAPLAPYGRNESREAP